MLKKRVGRGECWDFADQALRHAGAQSSTTSGRNDDYVWGTEIPIIAVVAGDILQFRDYIVRTVTTTTTTFTDGSYSTETEEKLEKRPHHTAIVAAVLPGKLTIFEQHVKPGGPHVQQHSLPIRPGTATTTVHEVVKTGSGARHATVVTTVNISISGKAWAYRPKAAAGKN